MHVNASLLSHTHTRREHMLQEVGLASCKASRASLGLKCGTSAVSLAEVSNNQQQYVSIRNIGHAYTR